VSKKNIPIAAGFAIITISQAALGICTVVLAAEKGGKINSSIRSAILIQSADLLRDIAQPKRSHRYLLMRIACAYLSSTER
jgi:hypothetical protein